jgi:hypothetical protein
MPEQAGASGAAAGAPVYEFPPYTLLKRADGYDLRLYGDLYACVEMPYERRDEPYLLLGAYIDGDNAAGTRFSYTQPVIMQHDAGGLKTMRMYVGSPRTYRGPADACESGIPGPAGAATVASKPAPKNPAVRLAPAGGELVAVIRFEGYITADAAAGARKRLVALLARDGVGLAEEEAAGRFRVAQYGPIHTMATRVNELLLRVKP